MIIHTIIKNKPHINLVDRLRDHFGRNVQQQAETNPPPVIALPGPVERRLIKNQAEYAEYIDKFDYTGGDFVTYRHAEMVRSLVQVHYVRLVVDQLDKVTQWTAGGIPQGVSFIGCWPCMPDYQSGPAFFEWTTGTSLRRLRKHEFEQHINDNVRYYIKERLAVYEAPAAD
jgi:hypothetical protein